MSYVKDYSRCDKYILENPEESISFIRGIISIKGQGPSDMIILNNSDKAKESRFFNGKVKKSLPDECRKHARAVGGLLKLTTVPGTDKQQLLFDPVGENFDVLLKQMRETKSLAECAIISGYEMVVSIFRSLEIEGRDYIVTTREQGRKTQRKLIETDGYIILLKNRYNDIAEFGIMISPDVKQVILGVWANADEDECLEFRQKLGMEDFDEKVFREAVESNKDWMPEEYTNNYLALIPLDLDEEGDIVGANIEMAFYIYNEFLEKETGRNVRDISPLDDLDELNGASIFPAELQKQIRSSNKVACTIDASHELVEGEDGRPYVDIEPLIPITREMFSKYGNKLFTKFNAVTLCPMCKARLEHSSWNVREDLLMKLYDSRIDGLKGEGVEVSRFEVLTAQREARGKAEDASPAQEAQIRRLTAYAQMLNKIVKKEDTV